MKNSIDIFSVQYTKRISHFWNIRPILSRCLPVYRLSANFAWWYKERQRKELGNETKESNILKSKQNCCVISSGTTRLPGSKKDSGSGTSVKDKDREMAKAINAEFSDDDDDDDDEDSKSAWDDEEKVIQWFD